MAFSGNEDECPLPTLVTMGSVIFKETTIFLMGVFSWTFLGAGARKGKEIRTSGRDSHSEWRRVQCQANTLCPSLVLA